MQLKIFLQQQSHKNSLQNCCQKNITSPLKLVVADTVIYILIVKKYITGRALGTLYEENASIRCISGKCQSANLKISQLLILPTISILLLCLHLLILASSHTFLFIKSDLRLVTDLQHCIKAQQSQAYAQKCKSYPI